MRQHTITVYSFNELSKDAQQKVLDNMTYINVGDTWWENVYEDAEQIGLKITSFDLDRNRHAKGRFIESAEHCAHLIIDNHGTECATYNTAKNYLQERDEAIDAAERDENGDFADKTAIDDILDELDNTFLKDILEDYSIMLQNEYEYQCSDEAIIQTIEANEYEFTKEGKRI